MNRSVQTTSGNWPGKKESRNDPLEPDQPRQGIPARNVRTHTDEVGRQAGRRLPRQIVRQVQKDRRQDPCVEDHPGRVRSRWLFHQMRTALHLLAASPEQGNHHHGNSARLHDAGRATDQGIRIARRQIARAWHTQRPPSTIIPDRDARPVAMRKGNARRCPG